MLDPGIARFVAEVGAAWASFPELAHATPPAARAIAERVREPWRRGGPAMAATVDRQIEIEGGAVRVRCHRPSLGAPLPALVYLHGGGWTFFSLDTHDRLMREYAQRAGAAVIGVDYSLAPEVKFPRAIEEVVAVVEWLGAHGGELGIAPGAIALGGDSAGGNLAVATCLALRDRGALERVGALLLNYAVLDRESSRDARERLGGAGAMLTASEMDGFWANYLSDPEQARDPRANPMLADLAGFPPTLLVAGAEDLLAEQSQRFARRLRLAGVPLRLDLYEGATHSFLEAVAVAELADRALAASSDWLREALSAVSRR